jgi:hypothetical protein
VTRDHSKNLLMRAQELYFFKVRDSLLGHWQQTRYRLTVAAARERFGEGKFELLEWSREVSEGDTARSTAAPPQVTQK